MPADEEGDTEEAVPEKKQTFHNLAKYSRLLSTSLMTRTFYDRGTETKGNGGRKIGTIHTIHTHF